MVNINQRFMGLRNTRDERHRREGKAGHSDQQNTGLGAHTTHTASDRMKELVVTRLAVSTIGNRATAMCEWLQGHREVTKAWKGRSE
ncbi:MAG: hypothetical protein CL610_15280 [Anaerolineaceae bacterium]|nr:hypothetical protein [Anaerolineaceae bacterium]